MQLQAEQQIGRSLWQYGASAGVQLQGEQHICQSLWQYGASAGLAFIARDLA
jgi:hypothetical protein